MTGAAGNSAFWYGNLTVKVAPLLVALARKHPALDVHLKCEDRLLDMVAERIDVAVRVLSALPAEFVARPLADDRRGLYASPAYLRGARAPKTRTERSFSSGVAKKVCLIASQPPVNPLITPPR